ncbi:MAG: ABC transporter ATP-binding protein [Lewinellaceae bacterium]|nr:ABC transporter ATP-binding protein [Lewinellaceae bacterium]
MSNIAIKVEHLSKRYELHKKGAGTLRDTLANAWKHGFSSLSDRESFWALDDISFEVPHGQVLGIIGRNGAGKSTLLKILSRITPPTKGRVELNGRVASLLEVGTGFHPELSGRENIFLNGAILGMSRAEIRRKFDEIVDFSGVERFLDTPVKHYSSGMYVRLAFAVAAHLEAEILLIDEVLAVGDVEFQRKCLGKMGELAEGGRTVLMVSHNLGFISQLCRNAAFLDQGVLKSLDITTEIIHVFLNSSIKGKIISFKNEDYQKILINGININNSNQALINLPPGVRNLIIEVFFEPLRNIKVSLGCILHDFFGKQIGFFSPGHLYPTKSLFTVEKGEYILSGEIKLPKLTKGRYFISIIIHNPGIEGYAFLEKAAEIFVNDFLSETGISFNQIDNGYLILEGNISCKMM